VGVVKASNPNFNCPRLWAEGIIAKYPHAIQSNYEAWDALKLYRKILSKQPDSSVTIVTVGTFTNLSNLLNSQPDEYSPLTGKQLIIKKVKQLVSMAVAIDSSANSGYESNVMGDIPAAQNIIHNWPTPITLSGFEIGVNIFTGRSLIHNTSINNSPIKDAYQIALAYDGSTEGRYSWDQTAVLVAVRGIDPYFNYRKLNFEIKDDGKDSVIAGDRITYLKAKYKPEEIGKIIEELMLR
jgi:inosine-uridine nucleoside N-ribohydrolase